jgi:hypothetical protein
MHALHHHCHETTAYAQRTSFWSHQQLRQGPVKCRASQARLYTIIANYHQRKRDQEQPKVRTSKNYPRQGEQPPDDNDSHCLRTNTRCELKTHDEERFNSNSERRIS